MWADIAFLSPLQNIYTYHIPFSYKRVCQVGTLAVVPLRKRRLSGIITKITNHPPEGVTPEAVKPILAIPLNTPVFNNAEMVFYTWCATYYHAAIGGILKTALPLPKTILRGEAIKLTDGGQNPLERLAAGGNIAAEKLVTRGVGVPVSSRQLTGCETWEDLLTWTDTGWVTWTYPGFAKNFHTIQIYYILNPNAPPLKRTGSREKEVIAILYKQGKVTRKDLLKKIPWAAAPVRQLLKKGIITEKSELLKPKSLEPLPPANNGPVHLSPEQSVALKNILEEMASPAPAPVLLHGITGGGKTELYIRAILATLKKGKSALILAPEIVLTPQLIARIQNRCGGNIVVWHSRLTGKQRWQQWLRLNRETPVIVVGVRSAIFAPIKNLGLIIVDEEHDPSFKQEEKLLYSARDMAVVRSRLLHGALILGSATPALESFHNVKTGKYHYCVITRRPTRQALPPVEIVDLKQEGHRVLQPTRGFLLSESLRKALIETLEDGHQALLFLNRRGYARTLTCMACGEKISCPRCSVSLTLHKPGNALICHYCGYHQAVPEQCTFCGGRLVRIGGGTQRLEEEIGTILPDARIARLDRDTMQRRTHYEAVLAGLKNKKIDILIGTQMIVKGHDFPGITLVGIVLADHSLNFPDFRAAERTFQLITQAAGRCGRGHFPGRVIVQTFSPQHYSILHASRHDFIGFYEEEITYRRDSGYPPFTRLAAIRISGKKNEAVAEKAEGISREARHLAENLNLSVTILGPAPALLSRLKGRYRWHILLKGKESPVLHRLVEKIFGNKTLMEGYALKVQVEFDPLQLT
jgi:primosomal protein N' (replication factor Y)